jgi:hypothetical protein
VPVATLTLTGAVRYVAAFTDTVAEALTVEVPMLEDCSVTLHVPALPVVQVLLTKLPKSVVNVTTTPPAAMAVLPSPVFLVTVAVIVWSVVMRFVALAGERLMLADG